MQNKKRMKTMIAATAMIGVLAIGGISAYFTDGDTATNTFTVGKVSIDLQEPNWNPPKDITPNQEIKKDPQIKNDGINDPYMKDNSASATFCFSAFNPISVLRPNSFRYHSSAPPNRNTGIRFSSLSSFGDAPYIVPSRNTANAADSLVLARNV